MSKTDPSKKIDILLITDNGLETVGGEQESVKIIINGVKDHFALGVIQPGKLNFVLKNVNYYHMTNKKRIKHLIKKPISFIRYIWKIKKLITINNPKVIHTQAQVSFFIVALLKKFRLIPKTILVHTERGLYIRYNSFFKSIFHFCMTELDVLITTTNFNMVSWEDAIKRKGLSLKHKVIENTAGELFETYNKEYIERKDNDSLVIGFAGRYSDQKNWPLAVEIVEKLDLKMDKELYVKMAVGCLDQKSEVETKKMFTRMENLLGSRFSGKINVDLDAMEKIYYEIDIFILTSLPNSESFGRTLVEAMSRKTVLLTTNAGGPVEVVGNDKNICETPDEFVEKVLKLTSDQKGMEKEKEINFERVREKYSLDNNIKKHFLLYQELVNKKD